MHIQNDIDADIAQLRRVAMGMDALYRIPGTRITIGFDNILGLIPVVGDLLATAPGLWIIYRAHKCGATPGALAYMLFNTTLDFAIGSIPVIGDIFDMLYNANLRNVATFERNINRRTYGAREVRSAAIPPSAQVI